MNAKSPTGITQNGVHAAFTLVELLVSIAVLTLLILIVTRMVGSASTITRAGGKHIDTDTQARAVLDRLAIDIGQMLKRTDLDYFVKQPDIGKYPGHSAGHGNGKKASSAQELNDQIAFFSQVPGYYPSPTQTSQSPLSLVAYRVNADSNSTAYLKLERMAKGLLWNGVSNLTNPNNANTTYPIVFLPQTLSGMGKPWYPAVNNDGSTNSKDPDYETIGSQVFRFEYFYVLKNGEVTDTPWDVAARPAQTTTVLPQSIGLVDIQAIVVAIAVIDPASRTLISPSSLFDLASDMADFKTAPGNGAGGTKKFGDVEFQWNQVVRSTIATGKTTSNSVMPPAAASAVRIYSRYFDLNSL